MDLFVVSVCYADVLVFFLIWFDHLKCSCAVPRRLADHDQHCSLVAWGRRLPRGPNRKQNPQTSWELQVRDPLKTLNTCLKRVLSRMEAEFVWFSFNWMLLDYLPCLMFSFGISCFLTNLLRHSGRAHSRPYIVHLVLRMTEN